MRKFVYLILIALLQMLVVSFANAQSSSVCKTAECITEANKTDALKSCQTAFLGIRKSANAFTASCGSGSESECIIKARACSSCYGRDTDPPHCKELFPKTREEEKLDREERRQSRDESLPYGNTQKRALERSKYQKQELAKASVCPYKYANKLDYHQDKLDTLEDDIEGFEDDIADLNNKIIQEKQKLQQAQREFMLQQKKIKQEYDQEIKAFNKEEREEMKKMEKEFFAKTSQIGRLKLQIKEEHFKMRQQIIDLRRKCYNEATKYLNEELDRRRKKIETGSLYVQNIRELWAVSGSSRRSKNSDIAKTKYDYCVKHDPNTVDLENLAKDLFTAQKDRIIAEIKSIEGELTSLVKDVKGTEAMRDKQEALQSFYDQYQFQHETAQEELNTKVDAANSNIANYEEQLGLAKVRLRSAESGMRHAQSMVYKIGETDSDEGGKLTSNFGAYDSAIKDAIDMCCPIDSNKCSAAKKIDSNLNGSTSATDSDNSSGSSSSVD